MSGTHAFYQPKVKTDSSVGCDHTDVIGVEALFRLDIPETRYLRTRYIH